MTISEIESEGDVRESYPVDKEYSSNEGDAIVYGYMNHLFEVITWRDGTKTMTDLGLQYDDSTKEYKRLHGDY